MARRGLRLDLRAALREAVETRRTVVREPVASSSMIARSCINLTVEPLGRRGDPLFLVLFSDLAGSGSCRPSGAPRPGGQSTAIDQSGTGIARHARAAAGHRRGIRNRGRGAEILQRGAAIVNEELQSTNEELETSKEELQSVNEELHTVNVELSAKVEEADQAHADLRNIFDSTQIATVFLDKNLCIRGFTAAVSAIFNLISSDRGRPLSDISSKLVDVDLRRDLRTVLERGETIERKVRRSDQNIAYLMRILPYRDARPDDRRRPAHVRGRHQDRRGRGAAAHDGG